MTAKLEVNEIGEGWVYVVEKNDKVRARQGDSVAALPTTWGKDEIYTYYTAGQDDSYVQVTPDEENKGCWVNAVKLEVGKFAIVGNVKITGA